MILRSLLHWLCIRLDVTDPRSGLSACGFVDSVETWNPLMKPLYLAEAAKVVLSSEVLCMRVPRCLWTPLKPVPLDGVYPKNLQ